MIRFRILLAVVAIPLPLLAEPTKPAVPATVPKSELAAIEPLSLDEAKMKALIAPWRKKLDATKRDTILTRLSAGADDVYGSKVGGVPYLPKGRSVPTGSSGRPLFLIAQINFAELPELPNYPKSGLLQFFIADNDYYGANFGGDLTEEQLSEQRDFRVVYYPEVDRTPGALVKSEQPASKTLPFSPAVPFKMNFTKTAETINSHDVRFAKFLGSPFYDWAETIAKKAGLDEDLVVDSLAEQLGTNDFQDKIGGYPSFTQEDPRPESTKKELLLQLSSNDAEGGMMWGDLGVAGFFIDPEDLKKRDFSKVMYSWDCS